MKFVVNPRNGLIEPTIAVGEIGDKVVLNYDPNFKLHNQCVRENLASVLRMRKIRIPQGQRCRLKPTPLEELV